MPTVMDGIIRWRGWLVLAGGLLFTPVEARPGLAAIRGGTSAAVIDARGELWVWGALGSRLGVPDPRLIEPQPRQVGRPPGVTGWAEALVADLVVARSVEGHLFLLQTEGTARGKALREPQPLGTAWSESLHCLRWRRDLPDGTAAVLGVAGLNASGAVELVRCVVPYLERAEDEPVASVSVGYWVLPFPPGVAAWKEMAAGEGWILTRTADGRLFEYLADDPATAMDDPRPWRPGPELAPGLGWIRLAGVRGDRAAWDSSGELHFWTWSEDPADATTRGRLDGLGRLDHGVPPSQRTGGGLAVLGEFGWARTTAFAPSVADAGILVQCPFWRG